MFDIHSLLDGKRKDITSNKNIWRMFNLWRRLASSHGKKDFDFESFFIGYTIGNNTMLKERITKLLLTEKLIEETFD